MPGVASSRVCSTLAPMAYMAGRWLSGGSTALASVMLVRRRQRAAPALPRRPRYPQRVVGGVQVIRAQRADRAIARQQSQAAIDAGDATRRATGGLRARRQILSSGGGQFQSIARADGGYAVAGNCVRRQYLQPLYRAAASRLHVRRLGPQSSRGGIAAGAPRRATFRR